MSDETATVGRQDEDLHPIIFFRPPGYYSDRVGETILEQIPIPDIAAGASRQFSFIITDRYEDGLCCSWKESSDTGYTLYNGDPAEGNVVVDSKFESTSKEVRVFDIQGGDSYAEDVESDAPVQSLEIMVTIALDMYPDETGFYIEDATNRRVVDVPPGTYKDANSLVEEIVTLEVGLYTFTILDSFGDGINKADGFYKLQLANEDDRLPVLYGSGAFSLQESRAFVIEGDGAQYPMFIRTPTVNSQLHFDVFRLDLVESDALVASLGMDEDDDTFDHMIQVTEGSLYRIILDNDGQDLDGSIEINLGTNDPAVFKGLEYVVRPDTTINPMRWQVKFFAGQSLVSQVLSDFEILTLRVKFDRFPSEFEWMLLSNDGGNAHAGTGLPKRNLIAFGPESLYDQSLEGETVIETIRIPRNEGDRGYVLLLTDSGNDGKAQNLFSSEIISPQLPHTPRIAIAVVGVCCSFGEGGPVELFYGDPEGGTLLFSESFRTGRLVKDFVLSGSASAASSCILACTIAASTTIFLLSTLL